MNDSYSSLHDALTEIAEAAARDTKATYGPDLDTDYDLYVEEVDGRTYGVIDMGDLFAAVYVCTPDGWEQTGDDAYAMVDRIAKVRSGGWIG